MKNDELQETKEAAIDRKAGADDQPNSDGSAEKGDGKPSKKPKMPRIGFCKLFKYSSCG